MDAQDRITTIKVLDVGQSRIVAFYSFADIIDCDDYMWNLVLICQDIGQVMAVFPHACEVLDAWINLEPIRNFISGIQSPITLGDVSRLYNDLMLSLGTRYVVPLSFFSEWQECADELIRPLNDLTKKICTEGLKQRLDTETVTLRFSQAQDEIAFVPSEAFIKCTKHALEFVESALYLDKPDEEIMPYCLIPVPYYSEPSRYRLPAPHASP